MKKRGRKNQKKVQKNPQDYVKLGLLAIVIIAVLGLLYASLGRDRVGQAGGTLGECTQNGKFYLAADGSLKLCTGGVLGSCQGDACTTTKTITLKVGQPGGKVIYNHGGGDLEATQDTPLSLSVGTQLVLSAPSGDLSVPSWAGKFLSFSGWRDDPTTQQRSIIVADNEEFTALWTQKFRVETAVEPAGAGTVTVSPTGTGATSNLYVEGTSISASAAESSDDYIFDKWDVQFALDGGGMATLYPLSIINPHPTLTVNKPYTPIKAIFARQYLLSGALDGNGFGALTGSVPGIDCGTDCSQKYKDGTPVTLTATAEAGNKFTGWGGLCEAVGTPKVPQKLLLSAASFTSKTDNPGNSLEDIVTGQLIPDLAWSSAGPIQGKTCVQFSEASDPDSWGDNYLCSSQNLGLTWHSAGPGQGTCVQITEPADPHTWNDNYLCSPQNYGLQWSYSGPIAGMTCVQITEPSEVSQGWDNNYLCYPSYGDLQGQTQYVGVSDNGIPFSLSAEIGSATYTFNVPVAGEYRISLGVATQNSASSSCNSCGKVEVDGQTWPRFSILNTGSFSTFREEQRHVVTLNAGQHVLKFTFYNSDDNNAAFRLAWIKLIPTSPLPTSGTCALTMDGVKAATAGFAQEAITDAVAVMAPDINTPAACPVGYGQISAYTAYIKNTPIRTNYALCMKKGTNGPFVDLTLSGTWSSCTSPATSGGVVNQYDINLCKTSASQPVYADLRLVPRAQGCGADVTLGEYSTISQDVVKLCAKGIVYGLTVSKAGATSGIVTSAPAGINCGADCTERYPRGTQVVLTARNSPGAVFDSWSGCDSVSGEQCTLTMDTVKRPVASFRAVTGIAVCTVPIVDPVSGQRPAQLQAVGTTMTPEAACLEYQVFGRTQSRLQPDFSSSSVASGEVWSPGSNLEFLKCTLTCGATTNSHLISSCKDILTMVQDGVDSNSPAADPYYVLPPEQGCSVS